MSNEEPGVNLFLQLFCRKFATRMDAAKSWPVLPHAFERMKEILPRAEELAQQAPAGNSA
jgi:hypothetical protein